MDTVPDGGGLDAVIVQRVSSKDARRERSVDDQETENRAECDANGWRVAAEYSQQNSASRFARTGGKRKTWAQTWAELTDAITTGAYGVVVMWESSRGDRTPETWFRFLSACRESGTLIHVTTHRRTYDARVARDWGVLAEDGVDNAKESEKISERSSRGIRMNVAAGKPHGDTPYGYERIYNERTKALIEQRADPGEAPIVREIKVRVAAGHPYRTITGDLNDRRIPTRTVTTRVADLTAAYDVAGTPDADRAAVCSTLTWAVWEGWSDEEITAALDRLAEAGRRITAEILGEELPEREPGTPLPHGIRWTHQVVKQIALNPAYIGQRMWRGKHGDGQAHPASWPAIIDEPTHYAAVDVITDPDRNHRSPGRDKYLLSFVVTCAESGHYLQGNGNSGVLPAYRCPGCRNTTRVPWLDAFIEQLVIRKLTSPGIWAQLTAADDAAITAARADVDAFQAKITEAADAYSRDRIGIEVVERTEAVVRPKLAAAQARLARLETSGPLRALVRGGPREELPQRWNDTPLPARKMIIRETFAYIRLQPAPPGSPRGVRAVFDPARVEWEWTEALK